MLLDCPAYVAIRNEARFAPLFADLAPGQARLRTFATQPRQHAVAAYVFECFEASARGPAGA
jgi:hypothetical protein